MKQFKLADIAISTGLILGFGIAALINGIETLMTGYFITGGWQVISMIVHTANGWFAQKGTARYFYHWLVAGIICMGVLTPFIFVFFIIYYIMLYAAPFMAISYTLICYFELRKMNKRPLAVLNGTV